LASGGRYYQSGGWARLDQFVERELIPVYTRQRRRTSPPYVALMTFARHQMPGNKGNLEEARRLSHEAQKIPSRAPHDPNFRRFWYTRYADDFLLGLSLQLEAVKSAKKLAATHWVKTEPPAIKPQSA